MTESLERLLHNHQVPASVGLEQRIVAAAQPRETAPGRWQALTDRLRPLPVAALACSLLLGLLVSRHLPYVDVPPPLLIAPKISGNAGSFLYYNGEIL